MTAKWQAQGNREAQIKELWNDYVPNHLLPRLHGYELMMARNRAYENRIKLYETGYFKAVNVRASTLQTLWSLLKISRQFTFAIPALAKEADAVNVIKSGGILQSLLGTLHIWPRVGFLRAGSVNSWKIIKKNLAAFCD